ncbi:MAG: serine/threonine protein kinase, partial [Deltaproteobacteria bacterium]|nr:serine/threonine protein kinase [Deltaproteobacteria bacterium]MBW2535198.1 serine/threonine protein kinase [Deltaproteobacteria bacterium]
MAKLPPPRRPPPPPRPSKQGRPIGGGGAPPAAAPGAAPAQAPAGPAAGVPPEDGYVLPQTFFVGRYRVVDEIGVGGMASVHLARVDGPGGFQKWVAIKRIHPHLVEDDQFVDMFLDEARIAAGINHANVAQVFDLGKDESTYWIAMEYLHGEPLRELMRRLDEQNAIIPFTLAARLIADAAEGLHGAHELRGRNGQLLNLVHRDVTPHNLFVTYDGYTKVVDFGIAKVVDRLASTRAGTLKGKLAYMSPEQVRGQEVDRRTDIFALGVVLWELTTNRRLFRMDTDLDTLEKVQACVVPLPSHVVPNYPRDLEEVVMRALAQRQEDRYQTAREFSRALQGFLMRQGTFVGPEDVGDYMKRTFVDRVEKRESYLEWAAEVTSTVDVDKLRAQKAASASGVQAGLPPPGDSQNQMAGAAAQAPAAAPAQPVAPLQPQAAAEMASASLMDEDEDIPTRVATSSDGPYEPQGAQQPGPPV